LVDKEIHVCIRTTLDVDQPVPRTRPIFSSRIPV
jgi:hypothetical protein